MLRSRLALAAIVVIGLVTTVIAIFAPEQLPALFEAFRLLN